jgi:hypothetical protein
MKRLSSLSIVSVLILVACGGGAVAAICEQAYWDGTVGTCLPAQWHVAEKDDLEARVPQEVFAAFQADKAFSGQYPTVTVTRETLAEDTASPDYSEASVASVQNLPGYEQIDDEQITIDAQKVRLHIFTAQPKPEDPKARFYQVSIAKGTAGFTFTGAAPLGVTDEIDAQIRLILQNATLVEAPKE